MCEFCRFWVHRIHIVFYVILAATGEKSISSYLKFEFQKSKQNIFLGGGGEDTLPKSSLKPSQDLKEATL